MMKAPQDQGLVLTIFYSVSLVIILMVWLFLPPTISHEDEDKPEVKILKHEDAIEKADEVLAQIETTLADLEKKQEAKAKVDKAKAGKAQDSKSGGKK